METTYKYKVIEGEDCMLTQEVHNENFKAHFTGMQIGSEGKKYLVAKMPYKLPTDSFYTVELKQVS